MEEVGSGLLLLASASGGDDSFDTIRLVSKLGPRKTLSCLLKQANRFNKLFRGQCSVKHERRRWWGGPSAFKEVLPGHDVNICSAAGQTAAICASRTCEYGSCMFIGIRKNDRRQSLTGLAPSVPWTMGHLYSQRSRVLPAPRTTEHERYVPEYRPDKQQSLETSTNLPSERHRPGHLMPWNCTLGRHRHSCTGSPASHWSATK